MVNEADYLNLKNEVESLRSENRDLHVKVCLREGEILRLRDQVERLRATARFENAVGERGNGG